MNSDLGAAGRGVRAVSMKGGSSRLAIVEPFLLENIGMRLRARLALQSSGYALLYDMDYVRRIDWYLRALEAFRIVYPREIRMGVISGNQSKVH